ncbi:MAG: S41 family peptidase [Candidatus Campbellbacteria bacterium]|nr:S41 family peptidase [Candidatus Campbellbacteria bacterium]
MKGTENEKKLWSSIKGLAEAYDDPYTTFFPPKEAKEFEMEISGNFEGVGMEVGVKDEVLTVIAPLKGTPAEKAGVEAGDKILQIDETPTYNLTIDEAVDMIRGEKGTEVVLTVAREGESETIEIPITRGVIQIPTIDTELRNDGVFVISLYNFSGNATSAFEEALKEFVETDSEKLILDLRGNPGGYLQAAVEMASYFLDSGEVVVRETGRGGEEVEVYRSKGYDIFDQELDMVVLVNRGSASASEILAGALSENNVATLVGEKTFGKGSVQEVVEITPETSLKVTIAKWLTPNGVSFSEEGLTPDVEVELNSDELNSGNDKQMERAVELLLEN